MLVLLPGTIMQETELTDNQLLSQIRKDDETAFNLLYDRYWKLLWQLAEKKTGNLGDAKDMVQDLFIDIWNRRNTLTVKGSLRVYLISALYLKVFRHFRTKGFREEQYEQFARFVEQTGEHAGTIALELAEAEKEMGSLHDIMEATIAQMPDQMRKVFILKHLHQYSNEQIANDLQISVHTVKNHLKKGRTRLRKAGEQYASGIILLAWVLESSY